ncbi:MAG TPA: penicillin-binding protein 2 [Gaiellaceae bacterium]|nr:penicillin-binding protein 2 [Gaiellaceae bacterium]
MLDAMSAIEAPFHQSAGFYARTGALGLVAIVAFGVLALRLWSLQILQGPRLQNVAASQSYRTVELPAPRGAIVDAEGRTLASTEGRLALTADPDTLGEIVGGQWTPTREGRRLLARVGRLAGDSVSTLVGRVRSSLFKAPYAPVQIVPRLKRDVASYLDERAEEFPGFAVAGVPTRSYPQGALGEEFLGLLGEIDEQQLHEKRFAWAKPGAIVGTSGIEATYDKLLNGGFSKGRVHVDSLGRQVGRLTVSPPPAPRSLELTIDARIQRAAEKAVRDGIAAAHANGHADANAGAAVVLDAKTGGVVALVSQPGFSQVAAARSPAYRQHLLSGGGSLYNQATQGAFPSGSTFKPIVAEAAMQAGLISPGTYLQCTGSYTRGGHVFHNVESWVNATMSLPTALAESCDTWFYRVGTMLYGSLEQGKAVLHTWGARLGFGHTTGLDLPSESGGVLPTRAWVKKNRGEDWYEGTSINLSIGQGYLAVTPLQLAVAYAAFANGGTVVRPHLAKAVLDPAGHAVKPLRFKPRTHISMVGLEQIREGLYRAANEPGGTSYSVFGNFSPPIAGKTGTAEAPPGSDHSWYASWAPAASPKYVVVVLIEHGGFGAEAAAPAAKEIYQALFRTK